MTWKSSHNVESTIGGKMEEWAQYANHCQLLKPPVSFSETSSPRTRQ